MTGQSKEARLDTSEDSLGLQSGQEENFFNKSSPHDTFLKMISELWGSF